MDFLLTDFFKNHLKLDINLISETQPIGGLSNKNFKVYYNYTPYFIRLCEPSLFNINRENELKVLHKASNMNLCKAPLYFNKSNGNMISTWINGNMPTEQQLNSQSFLNNLCKSLKKLHKEKSENDFNPFSEIRNRIKLCRDLNISLPTYIYSLTTKLSQLEESLSSHKLIGLCHNDLNVSNIILSDEDLYIIDYEFSGNCDIFFDLATIAWLQDYNGRVNLLKSYFGHFNIKDYNKLLKYLYVVKFLNGLWSLIKSYNSTNNYNYKYGADIVFNELYNYELV